MHEENPTTAAPTGPTRTTAASETAALGEMPVLPLSTSVVVMDSATTNRTTRKMSVAGSMSA